MTIRRVTFDLNAEYIDELEQAHQRLRDVIRLGGTPPLLLDWRSAMVAADAIAWVLDNMEPE